jgi:hypothetical protein
VNSTRDFYIDDHATVTEIIDLLLNEGIPTEDHNQVIFNKFEKQGFKRVFLIKFIKKCFYWTCLQL